MLSSVDVAGTAHFLCLTETRKIEEKMADHAKFGTWFEAVFGFPEPVRYDSAQNKFHVIRKDDGELILGTTTDPSKQFHVGKFETPSVSDLRLAVSKANGNVKENETTSAGRDDDGSGGGDHVGLRFRHVVGDAGKLHRDPSNAGAVFQAASQFNCLEMATRRIKPDDGITRYIVDRTQGPACALACPAGTVYRNYFASGADDGSVGQGKTGVQIDLLSDIGRVVGNDIPEDESENANSTNENAAKKKKRKTEKTKYWKVQNGYALELNRESMAPLATRLLSNNSLVDGIIANLRVGVHWDTEVSYVGHESDIGDRLPSPPHRVCQVYCSAIPMSEQRGKGWEPLARAILNGLYEATLAVGVVKQQEQPQGRIKIYLTMVGGGVFANKDEWIVAAIKRALTKFQDYPLDVYLVHYGRFAQYYVENIPDTVGK